MPRAHDKRCFLGDPISVAHLVCICDRLREAYREGYSDHARSVQHWQDTHGAYRGATDPLMCPKCRHYRDTPHHDYGCNQHGEGENP